MLTSVTEVIISLMISIFGQGATAQDGGDRSNDIRQYSPDAPEKNVIVRPVEALGGGFKKL